MKPHFFIIVLLGTLLATAACSTLQVSSAPPLTTEALKNAEYIVEGATEGKAQLTNGTYKQAIAPGSASELTVTLTNQAAFGDLNGDRVPDAATVYVTNSGGSGSFYYLAAVLNDNGKPNNTAVTLLGDRIQVKSLTIVDRNIAVDLLTQGPNDPQCCPSLPVTKKFKLQGNTFVEVK